ncbi:MAG: DMT family transporter [Stenotrophobium sp.]
MSVATPAARAALPALVAGAVFIGFAPIFVRLTDVGYTACAFWRVALALPVLLLWLRPGTGAERVIRPGIAWLWLAGLFFAADLAVWHQSIRYTSVANATLMANLAPVFVTLASFAFFGERFRVAFLAGIALAIGGAAVLVSNSLRLGGESATGDLLGVLSAVFYSGYIIGIARARQRFTAAESLFWSTLASACALLPLAWLLGDSFWPQSRQGWAVLLGLALLSQSAGQGLIAYALAHLRPAFSAVGLLVQPVAAAVLAWWLLAEPLGARQAAGAAIVLAGIVICRLTMAASKASTN